MFFSLSSKMKQYEHQEIYKELPFVVQLYENIMIPVPKSPDDNGSFFTTIVPTMHPEHIQNVSLLFVNSLCLFQTESFLKLETISYSLLFPTAYNILDITEYFMKEWKRRESRKRAQRQWKPFYSILYILYSGQYK